MAFIRVFSGSVIIAAAFSAIIMIGAFGWPVM